MEVPLAKRELPKGVPSFKNGTSQEFHPFNMEIPRSSLILVWESQVLLRIGTLHTMEASKVTKEVLWRTLPH